MKTKLPKPKRLPSGSWRCQVTAPSGKLVSITEATPELAQAKAVAVKNGIAEVEPRQKRLTLEGAIDLYIESKSSVLSPSTIRGYEGVKKNRFRSLMKLNVYNLTKQDVQRAVNAEAKKVSPKTVYNAYGLIRPVLKDCGVDVFGITLPQRVKKKKPFVQPEELGAFIDALEDDPCRTPIIMALWLGMRRSEILGLCWDCVDMENGKVTVRRVLVPNKENHWVLRDGAKNESSQRTISCPEYLLDQLRAIKEKRITAKPWDRIFRQHPDTIRRHVHDACKRAGITDTNLHGLRHTNAAIMMHLGVSDAHAMSRGGWTNERTYKDTYSYVFQTAAGADDAKINGFFNSVSHEFSHGK